MIRWIVMFMVCVMNARVWAGSDLRKANPHEWIFAGNVLIFQALQSEGYDVSDVNELKRAASDSSSCLRRGALTMLAQRVKDKAVPRLLESVDDSDMSVRCRVAYLLAMYGETGGLDRIRKDLALLQTEITANHNPSNAVIEERDELPLRRIDRAFEVIEVLACFGDCRGFDFTHNILNTRPGYKDRAVDVLLKMARYKTADEDKQVCGPVSVIVSVIESESDLMTLSRIAHSAIHLKNQDAIIVLRKLDASKFVKGELKEFVISWIESLDEEQGVK